MKRYAVVFEESAQTDVRESYVWAGLGASTRHNNGFALRTAVSQQLTVVLKGFPLAPEDDEFFEEIRQMIVLGVFLEFPFFTIA